MYTPTEIQDEDEILDGTPSGYLRDIAKSVRAIKNILKFYLFLTLVGIGIWILYGISTMPVHGVY